MRFAVPVQCIKQEEEGRGKKEEVLEREIHVRFRNSPLPVRDPLKRNDIYISRQNERCCRFRGEEVRES